MTTEFGELVLILGDFYIPQRAAWVPKEFQQLLATDKIKHVLCTGNVTSPDIMDLLNSVGPNVHVVAGETDVDQPPGVGPFPEYEVIMVENLRIGLINGYQVIPGPDPDLLEAWQRKLDCDVLVYGSTGRNTADQVNGKFFINPGSITGAIANEPPSFILMAINPPDVNLYVYELVDGKLKITMSSFSKS